MNVEEAKSFMEKVEAGVLATTDGFRVAARQAMKMLSWNEN